MAENIGISFTANKNQSDEKRISDIELYLKQLTDRVKFCFTQMTNGEREQKSGGRLAMENPLSRLLSEESLEVHTADTDNPHSVTKAQIGLGNADNTSDIDKPVSKATQQALSLKADLTELANKSDKSELIAHTDNADNPHNLTVSQIGLCYPNLMPGSWQYDNLVADSTFTGINTEQFSVTPGQSLTVSCEASTTVSVTDKAIFLLQYYAEKNGTRISWEAFIGTITETGVFVPLQQTVTVPDGINYMSLGLRYYNCPKTFRKFKVENGELKTAWTVAVQDIIDNEARISALETAGL